MAKKQKAVVPMVGVSGSVSGMFGAPAEPSYMPFPSRQEQGPSQRNLVWTDLIAKGESPRGLRVETANGTGSDQGRGWNRKPPYRDNWEAEEGGPWQSGPSNRTAE